MSRPRPRREGAFNYVFGNRHRMRYPQFRAEGRGRVRVRAPAPAHGYCLPRLRVIGITLAGPLCLSGFFGRRTWVSFGACAADSLSLYAAMSSSAMTGSSMR